MAIHVSGEPGRPTEVGEGFLATLDTAIEFPVHLLQRAGHRCREYGLCQQAELS